MQEMMEEPEEKIREEDMSVQGESACLIEESGRGGNLGESHAMIIDP